MGRCSTRLSNPATGMFACFLGLFISLPQNRSCASSLMSGCTPAWTSPHCSSSCCICDSCHELSLVPSPLKTPHENMGQICTPSSWAPGAQSTCRAAASSQSQFKLSQSGSPLLLRRHENWLWVKNWYPKMEPWHGLKPPVQFLVVSF